jgi:hypothetical protein
VRGLENRYGCKSIGGSNPSLSVFFNVSARGYEKTAGFLFQAVRFFAQVNHFLTKIMLFLTEIMSYIKYIMNNLEAKK